jgi:ectoine hydroxylase-related dioxygenase (phytanoyl-CoA dioxygenase family)
MSDDSIGMALAAEPVFASAGDVVIFTEGITHNAFPVLDNSRRRSLFFNWVPSIDRNVSSNTSFGLA